MTARVDTQAAKERAERTLLAWGATGNVRKEAEALARDVLALVGLLADAEKARDDIRQRARSYFIDYGPVLPEAIAFFLDDLSAFDAAGGKGE